MLHKPEASEMPSTLSVELPLCSVIVCGQSQTGRRGSVAGELEAAARQFTASLDALDVDAMVTVLADDVEGVEEISRQWLRGRDAVAGYMRELATQVSDVRSELRDLNERVWGDVGVVTCWLDQTYTYAGQPVRISAPTTLVFRRDAGEWNLVLFHSVPLADQE
jgi:ketosteroid isomerase-like protein